ncbi:MaoC/PaaZ C-terminal domain-containing protein [Acidocella sp.]|uniref:MaoC/PaaZ C-terminal domain-containing protein n=1 Tax=Acidocella sp. TaxID=50710 RepID=UPI002636ECDD|nr:MaoC/PaaZ C-terminal domain-containing protein [Acidocella sp.]
MGKYDHVIGKEVENGYWSWESDRALLYAVGVGAGLPDPLQELQFTTENSPGLAQQVLPTFMVMMSAGGSWIPSLGFGEGGSAPIGMVHGEQSITLARTIPPRGRVHVSRVLVDVYDKGSGALVVTEARVTLADTGEHLGVSRMGLFVQGRGGFGGPRTPPDERPWSRPERQPDQIVSLPVGPNQSLIYRLSGDRTLHGTDPVRARADGFERPVFFGLGTYGVAGRALLMGLCENDVARFGHIEGRFSKPVFPGDRLDMHIWHNVDGAQFQLWANNERLAMDRGVFRFRRA